VQGEEKVMIDLVLEEALPAVHVSCNLKVLPSLTPWSTTYA
jgi:hypothetical protein